MSTLFWQASSLFLIPLCTYFLPLHSLFALIFFSTSSVYWCRWRWTWTLFFYYHLAQAVAFSPSLLLLFNCSFCFPSSSLPQLIFFLFFNFSNIILTPLLFLFHMVCFFSSFLKNFQVVSLKYADHGQLYMSFVS
ncbi:hypothetical protein K457DRAFT_1911150, partial [Linnemannia elongata AG-77]